MQTSANLMSSSAPWILFLAFVALMLALDLGVIHRKQRASGLAESLCWTALWVGLAAAFAVLLYLHGQRIVSAQLLSQPVLQSPGPAASAPVNHRLSLEFVTGYLVELALSVDNLFIFLLIFRAFKVPAELQHKVLFWGIIGAILMRAAFIAAGVTLMNRFQWISYLFGTFLICAGIRLLLQDKNTANPTGGAIARFAKQHLRFTGEFAEGAFTLRRNGKLCFTALALVLLVVETTDVVFAVDSIPAVLAVTRQPFIVFTSNIFAILGLRALYFVLAGLMDIFHLLHYGLAAILVFIGAKMLAANYYEIPTLYALAIIVAALACSMLLSLAFPSRRPLKPQPSPGAGPA
jgi:tellurite resistance protein TerC